MGCSRYHNELVFQAVNLVGAVADNELREIVDQFRTSGVHELYYSDSELARQKITFF